MGYSNYSDDAAEARVSARVSAGKPAVASYTADIASGAAPAKVHTNLDPHGLLFRESRDSENHPESVPVVLILDETGSMGNVIKQIQKSIRSIMKLLVSKGYLPHPHIMVIAIGDALNHEKAPLQVSQFESDDKIEQCIDDIFIEMGGGPGMRESYQNAAYVVAYKTRTDHWDKRGQKGYVFFFGDEINHQFRKEEVISLIGTDDERNLPSTLPLRDLYDMVKERYHTFFVLPKRANNGGSSEVINHWKVLLGDQAVLQLDDENAAGEFVAAQIGLIEENTDIDGIAKDLTDLHGASASTNALVKSVASSVSTSYRGDAIARVQKGALATSDKPVNVGRL